MEAAEARMDQVRRGYGYEGEVLYYVDGRDNVIGETSSRNRMSTTIVIPVVPTVNLYFQCSTHL